MPVTVAVLPAPSVIAKLDVMAPSPRLERFTDALPSADTLTVTVEAPSVKLATAVASLSRPATVKLSASASEAPTTVSVTVSVAAGAPSAVVSITVLTEAAGLTAGEASLSACALTVRAPSPRLVTSAAVRVTENASSVTVASLISVAEAVTKESTTESAPTEAPEMLTPSAAAAAFTKSPRAVRVGAAGGSAPSGSAPGTSDIAAFCTAAASAREVAEATAAAASASVSACAMASSDASAAVRNAVTAAPLVRSTGAVFN